MCDLIANKLTKAELEKGLYEMRSTEIASYIKDYNSTVSTATEKDKNKALQEIYEKYLTMQSSNAFVVQAVKAIKGVKVAHSTMKKEVEKNKFTSDEIVSAIGKLNDLASHIDDLEALMVSCETEIGFKKGTGIVCMP